jgi:hypothetical protein
MLLNILWQSGVATYASVTPSRQHCWVDTVTLSIKGEMRTNNVTSANHDLFRSKLSMHLNVHPLTIAKSKHVNTIHQDFNSYLMHYFLMSSRGRRQMIKRL